LHCFFVYDLIYFCIYVLYNIYFKESFDKSKSLRRVNCFKVALYNINIIN
jgi:hypothetical protein